MKIAILAWGSLIWCPRELAVSSRWRLGPELPVEFARKSQDHRVTLVLWGEHRSETFWALSSLSTIDAACSNLWQREGEPKFGSIHYTTGEGLRTLNDRDPEDGSLDVSNIVTQWLETVPDIDCAIWTGLPTKGFDQSEVDLATQVVDHLRDLDKQSKLRAKDYVQFAPVTVRTPVRLAVEADPLRWLPRELPSNLFEEAPSAGP